MNCKRKVFMKMWKRSFVVWLVHSGMFLLFTQLACIRYVRIKVCMQYSSEALAVLFIAKKLATQKFRPAQATKNAVFLSNCTLVTPWFAVSGFHCLPCPTIIHRQHKLDFQSSLPTLYASEVILALPLVTLTPSCLARATISIRFLEETACAISAA